MHIEEQFMPSHRSSRSLGHNCKFLQLTSGFDFPDSFHDMLRLCESETVETTGLPLRVIDVVVCIVGNISFQYAYGTRLDDIKPKSQTITAKHS